MIPLLFDLDTSEVTGPLVQFQQARFSRLEMKRVVETINAELSDQRLEPAVLDEVFEMWWPKLEATVARILGQAQAPSAIRSDRDILEEVLSVTRTFAKSHLRSEARRIDGISAKVIGDLAKGLSDVTMAAA